MPFGLSQFTSGEAFVANDMSVHIDRDGDGVPEELLVDFVYQPLTTAAGEVFGIMVHAIETTERVQIGRRSEALATGRSAILGQIADVVVTADASGNLTFVNDAARALYGDMRTGIPIWDAAQPFQLLTASGALKPLGEVPLYRALRDERVTNEEWRIRRANGSEVAVQGSAVPLRAADGTLMGAAMTVRDVTEQRAMQRQLEHERSRLQEVLMQAPAAISVPEGPDHVLVMQNEIARQLVAGRGHPVVFARGLPAWCVPWGRSHGSPASTCTGSWRRPARSRRASCTTRR